LLISKAIVVIIFFLIKVIGLMIPLIYIEYFHHVCGIYPMIISFLEPKKTYLCHSKL